MPMHAVVYSYTPVPTQLLQVGPRWYEAARSAMIMVVYQLYTLLQPKHVLGGVCVCTARSCTTDDRYCADTAVHKTTDGHGVPGGGRAAGGQVRVREQFGDPVQQLAHHLC